MDVQRIPFDRIPQLSNRDKAYYEGNAALRPFYKYPVNLAAFQEVILDKQKEHIDRDSLVKILEEQYASLNISSEVKGNIQKLGHPNAFTLITAHQPSLFTGPLYYIFKIISTINLAKELKNAYPEQAFIPVFITGGEDHDFAEVNYLNIFNKKLVWESGETGSVGKMNTNTIQPVLAELKNILGEQENAERIYQIIQKAHTDNEYYAEATIQMVNELFGKDGLVVINMSHRRLKRLFIPIIKKEILERPSESLIQETVERLEAAGFTGQAHPRAINFFYLDDQIRERIVFEDERYKVLNTNKQFSEAEIISEIENHPEKFSPNVVMRPIYQEYVLPNLAYIGGGGELAYWLERKTQFEYFGLNFPMLIRRNSAMWIDKGTAKRLHKLDIPVTDSFQDVEILIKRYVAQNAEEELSLAQEKIGLKTTFEQVAEKTGQIDPTLVKSVWAEHAKQLKSLENLEAKIHRAEKRKHETAIQQIRSLKEKLNPGNNGLQERHDNFLSFYLKYGDSFFDTLKEHLHPLERGFTVIIDN